MKNNLGKNEKLKSQSVIKNLFLDKKSLYSGEVRVFYKKTSDADDLIKVGFSVPKRNFKKAVDRNYIKRMMREAYRLQKNLFEEKFDFYLMFFFMGKETPKYSYLHKHIAILIRKLNQL